jgi:hypothetical protein
VPNGFIWKDSTHYTFKIFSNTVMQLLYSRFQEWLRCEQTTQWHSWHWKRSIAGVWIIEWAANTAGCA